MKMPIAILAACAGTLAVAQTDLAQAAYAGTTESKMPVTDVRSEPVTVVALLVNISHSNIRGHRRMARPGATGNGSTTRGRVLPKNQTRTTGSGATKSSISDQASGGILLKKKN